jgi:hypothetical protein
MATSGTWRKGDDHRNQLERLTIRWVKVSGWPYSLGPAIVPEGAGADPTDYRAVTLTVRLVLAVRRADAQLPVSTV